MGASSADREHAAHARLRKIAREMRAHLLQSERFEATRLGATALSPRIDTNAPIRLKMLAEKGRQRPHLLIDYGEEHHTVKFALFPPAILEEGRDIPTHVSRALTQYIDRHVDALGDIWRDLQAPGDPSSLTVELPRIAAKDDV